MKKRASEKLAMTRYRGSVQKQFVRARCIADHLLCLTSNTTSYEFVTILLVEGISYDLKSSEEQQLLNEQFQAMLAGLTYPVQILWRVLPLNMEEYLDQLTFLPQRGEEAEGVLPLIASSHATFLHELSQRRTLLRRAIYLILRVDGQGKPQSRAQRFLTRKRRSRWSQQLEQARQELDVRSSELMRQLGDMNLFVKRLRGEQELTPFYYSCLTPAKADRFPLPWQVIAAIDRPIQVAQVPQVSRPFREDQEKALMIVPPHHPEPPAAWSQLADLVSPAAITLMPDHLRVEKDYVRALVVHALPRIVHAGWLKPLADLDEPMEVSFHVQPLNSTAMIQQLRRQNRAYHSSQLLAQRKGNDSDPTTRIAGGDVDDLLPRLASGEERMLNVSLLVQVRGTSLRQLNERTERVKAVLGTMLLVAYDALFEQDKAFRSCLPHACNEMSALLLDSRSTSTLFPFLANSLFHTGGVLEGVTPQGDPIIIDPWGEGMVNANRIILGPPGWGKSHAIKTILIRQILKSICEQQRSGKKTLCSQTIVIDPEREYAHLTSLFGGQVVHLAPGSAQQINPFDLPQIHEEDEYRHANVLADHVGKLHDLLDIMLADRTPTGTGRLDVKEKGLLDRAILEVYRKVGITEDRTTHNRQAPLMRDLYDVLGSEDFCDLDTTGVQQRLGRYVYRGSLAGLFAGPTNVSLDRIIVDFDVKDLGTELRPISLFLVSNYVWMQSLHAKIPRLVVVDEAATIMDYESGATFLEDLVRRGRKYYVGFWLGTQNPRTFAASAIPANCATHVLTRQDATTIDLVEQMFKLSPRELHLVRRLPVGEALLLTSEKRLQVRFEASEVEHLLATTDKKEKATWPERRQSDAHLDQLLHQLGLGEVHDDEEAHITAKLPMLKEVQVEAANLNHHQQLEVER